MKRFLRWILNLFRSKSNKVSSDSGKLITVPGASFDLAEKEVNSYYGFIDLSGLLHGDEVIISEHFKPWRNRGFILHKSQKFNGPVEFPLISFPERWLDCSVKIVLKQNTGMSRDIWYSFNYS